MWVAKARWAQLWMIVKLSGERSQYSIARQKQSNKKRENRNNRTNIYGETGYVFPLYMIFDSRWIEPQSSSGCSEMEKVQRCQLQTFSNRAMSWGLLHSQQQFTHWGCLRRLGVKDLFTSLITLLEAIEKLISPSPVGAKQRFTGDVWPSLPTSIHFNLNLCLQQEQLL